jgi:alpha-beta hydrolase superfamily lysophospholipase
MFKVTRRLEEYPQPSPGFLYICMQDGSRYASQVCDNIPTELDVFKIPVHENAPLINPPEGMVKQWPLILFSHGLGGTHTSYSQICTRLAAEGNVVLAIEHRDGTAPADGQGRFYTRETDVQYVFPRQSMLLGI